MLLSMGLTKIYKTIRVYQCYCHTEQITVCNSSLEQEPLAMPMI